MPIRLKPGRSPRPAVHDDFFIPELCEAEALFTLVLLAELLVLVLVLAEPMTPSFNWVRLALASLFVQWIVLLSAALFCRLRPLLARLPVALAGGRLQPAGGAPDPGLHGGGRALPAGW